MNPTHASHSKIIVLTLTLSLFSTAARAERPGGGPGGNVGSCGDWSSPGDPGNGFVLIDTGRSLNNFPGSGGDDVVHAVDLGCAPLTLSLGGAACPCETTGSCSDPIEDTCSGPCLENGLFIFNPCAATTLTTDLGFQVEYAANFPTSARIYLGIVDELGQRVVSQWVSATVSLPGRVDCSNFMKTLDNGQTYFVQLTILDESVAPPISPNGDPPSGPFNGGETENYWLTIGDHGEFNLQGLRSPLPSSKCPPLP